MSLRIPDYIWVVFMLGGWDQNQRRLQRTEERDKSRTGRSLCFTTQTQMCGNYSGGTVCVSIKVYIILAQTLSWWLPITEPVGDAVTLIRIKHTWNQVLTFCSGRLRDYMGITFPDVLQNAPHETSWWHIHENHQAPPENTPGEQLRNKDNSAEKGDRTCSCS